ncbi:hypothetical protein V5F59_13515 [Xanthobacter autotrophicus DSM 431]|uniref:hypothetical protein n=1 Tax=Xanthobacter nonsaccharivorans TaxID=3119912 RepID=UPI0037284896
MGKRIVAVRYSPDWLGLTDDDTRTFLRRHGIDENLLVDFMALWDGALKVDYRSFRHELAGVSRASFAAVRGAEVIPHEVLRETKRAADDLIVFVDDDDWLSPGLFEALETACPHPLNGIWWGSILVGPQFESYEAALREPIVALRPLKRIIYTNNYAVTGRALNWHGYGRLFEHYHADRRFRKFLLPPKKVPLYLSAASKHPCSTVAVQFLMAQPQFRADIRAYVARFADQLEEADIPAEYAWLREPVRQVEALVRRALG